MVIELIGVLSCISRWFMLVNDGRCLGFSVLLVLGVMVIVFLVEFDR